MKCFTICILFVNCYSIFNFLSGCILNKNPDISGSSRSVEINIDNLNTDGTVYFSDLFESFEIIPLETTSESLIGKINSVSLIKNKIIILDRFVSKSVFLFNINGDFIRKIGRLGKGPGEYILPSSISSDETIGKIAVYDGMLNKISLYDINGVFEKSIKLKSKIAAKSIELCEDKIYISNYAHDLISFLVYAIDFDGNVLGEWLPNTYPEGFSDNTQLSTNTIFFQTNKNLKFRNWLMNAVYNIEGNSINPTILLKSNNNFTKDELVEIKNYQKGNYFMRLLRSNKFIGISSYIEVNDLAILEYLNNSKTYVLFYNHKTGSINCTPLLKFHDDMTNFPGRVMSFFHTAYDGKLIAPVTGRLMDDLIENVKESGKFSTNHNLQNLTYNSNPCIVMYKCKKKPNL